MHLSDLILRQRNELVAPVYLEGFSELNIARVKMALDFRRKGLGFCFRAIFEEWDQQRLLLEIYV